MSKQKPTLTVFPGGSNVTFADRVQTILNYLGGLLDEKSNCTIVINFPADGGIQVISDPVLNADKLAVALNQAERTVFAHDIVNLILGELDK